MTAQNANIKALNGLLDQGPQKIVLLSHANPDGDSIGSSLALRSLLVGRGHTVSCIVPNRYPAFLEWMTGIDQVRIFRDEASCPGCKEDILAADVIFCLDFNQISRMEGVSEVIAQNTHAKRVLIDHHLNPPAEEYDLMFSDPEANSTSFLLYNIITALKAPIDRATAEALYVGMMTDTGNFSFSNLTPAVFRAVADLVERTGIHTPTLYNNVYNNFSADRMRPMGYALDRKMEMVDGYGVAFMSLKENELRRYHFGIGDSEGFVNLPLAIRGIRMSAMILQNRNFIRLSFRSRGEVDVNVFANKYFEGGGHKNASGGKSFEPMEQTIEKFKAAVKDYFEPLPKPAKK